MYCREIKHGDMILQKKLLHCWSVDNWIDGYSVYDLAGCGTIATRDKLLNSSITT